MAGIHMEGPADPWFQMMQKANQLPSWSALTSAVEEHFGPTEYVCARAQLFKLTQQGSFDECVKAFLALANRSEEMSEGSLIDRFIGGSKPELRHDVVAQIPTTLLKAIALGRLFAARDHLVVAPARSITLFSPSPTSGSSKNTGGSGVAQGGSSNSQNVTTSVLSPLLPTQLDLRLEELLRQRCRYVERKDYVTFVMTNSHLVKTAIDDVNRGRGIRRGAGAECFR